MTGLGLRAGAVTLWPRSVKSTGSTSMNPAMSPPEEKCSPADADHDDVHVRVGVDLGEPLGHHLAGLPGDDVVRAVSSVRLATRPSWLRSSRISPPVSAMLSVPSLVQAAGGGRCRAAAAGDADAVRRQRVGDGVGDARPGSSSTLPSPQPFAPSVVSGDGVSRWSLTSGKHRLGRGRAQVVHERGRRRAARSRRSASPRTARRRAPCASAPCTWPSSRTGLRIVPASCTVETFSMRTFRVTGSTRTTTTSATNP